MYSSAIVAPSATQSRGRSAMWQGMPVSSVSSRSTLRQRAAAGQHHAAVDDVGGEFRRHLLQHGADHATTPASGSCSAVAISFDVTVIVRGIPLTWSRPRSWVRSVSSTGRAEPMAIFRSSAVRSPDQAVAPLDVGLDRLVEAVAGHALGVPDDHAVHRDHGRLGAPAAMSTTRFPRGVATGSPAPIAAASGSGTSCAGRRAPACSAASRTARCSTVLTPAGRRS